MALYQNGILLTWQTGTESRKDQRDAGLQSFLPWKFSNRYLIFMLILSRPAASLGHSSSSPVSLNTSIVSTLFCSISPETETDLSSYILSCLRCYIKLWPPSPRRHALSPAWSPPSTPPWILTLHRNWSNNLMDLIWCSPGDYNLAQLLCGAEIFRRFTFYIYTTTSAAVHNT